MRPRVFPAEDKMTRPAFARNSSRFNEAAGIPRGRRTTRCMASRRMLGLQ